MVRVSFVIVMFIFIFFSYLVNFILVQHLVKVTALLV